MKINEKNLAAFASSTSAIDREGLLSKRGEVNKAFQKRYFLLKGNLLFYFEKKGDKEPMGVIILEGATIELAEDEEQYSFKVAFHGCQGRSYILSAETQESMEQWMKALACASYDYMKVMVAELQRQLDELEAIKMENETPVEDAPKAPPRGQRYNPFNKSENGSFSKARTGKTERLAENVPRTKMAFRELHTLYGRKILTDYNEWRHKQLQAANAAKNEETLVEL